MRIRPTHPTAIRCTGTSGVAALAFGGPGPAPASPAAARGRARRSCRRLLAAAFLAAVAASGARVASRPARRRLLGAGRRLLAAGAAFAGASADFGRPVAAGGRPARRAAAFLAGAALAAGFAAAGFLAGAPSPASRLLGRCLLGAGFSRAPRAAPSAAPRARRAAFLAGHGAGSRRRRLGGGAARPAAPPCRAPRRLAAFRRAGLLGGQALRRPRFSSRRLGGWSPARSLRGPPATSAAARPRRDLAPARRTVRRAARPRSAWPAASPPPPRAHDLGGDPWPDRQVDAAPRRGRSCTTSVTASPTLSTSRALRGGGSAMQSQRHVAADVADRDVGAVRGVGLDHAVHAAADRVDARRSRGTASAR